MPGPDSTPPAEIDAATLAELMRDPRIVVIDVREPEEYAAEHIPGTVSMPMSTFDPKQAVAQYGDRNMIMSCLSGARSSAMADEVAALGRPRPPSLRDGIKGWKAAGLPTESS